MGLLRFLLAAGVILFHSGGVSGYALTGGGPSVQGFYVVSGFFMTLILNEKYDTPAKNRLFFTNRLIRIFSCYWFFLLASVLWFATTASGPFQVLFAEFDGLAPASKLYLVATNLVIFGMDAGLFLGLHGGALVVEPFTQSPAPQVHDFFVVPQAWSLGVELWFYLVAPFLVRRSWRAVLAVVLAGLAARLLSGLDGDPWTNRFFPFELPMFLLGALAYRRFAAIKRRALAGWEKALAAAPPLLVLAYPLYGVESSFYHPGRWLFLAGLAVGLPYLFHLTRNMKSDRMVGELSYPLYLCHGLAIALLSALTGLTGSAFCLATLAASVVVAVVAVRLIELPVDRLRQMRLAG